MGANHSTSSGHSSLGDYRSKRRQTKPSRNTVATGFTNKSLKGAITPRQLAESGVDVAAAVEEATKKRFQDNPGASVIDSHSGASSSVSSPPVRSVATSTRHSGQLQASHLHMVDSRDARSESGSDIGTSMRLNPHDRYVSHERFPSDAVADLDDILHGSKSPTELLACWNTDDWDVLCSWADAQFRCQTCGSSNNSSSASSAASTSSSSSGGDGSRGSFSIHPRIAHLLSQLCTSYKMTSAGRATSEDRHLPGFQQKLSQPSHGGFSKDSDCPLTSSTVDSKSRRPPSLFLPLGDSCKADSLAHEQQDQASQPHFSDSVPQSKSSHSLNSPNFESASPALGTAPVAAGHTGLPRKSSQRSLVRTGSSGALARSESAGSLTFSPRSGLITVQENGSAGASAGDTGEEVLRGHQRTSSGLGSGVSRPPTTSNDSYDLNMTFDKLPTPRGGRSNRLRRTSSDNMLFIPEIEETPNATPLAAASAGVPTDEPWLLPPSGATVPSTKDHVGLPSQQQYQHAGSLQEQRQLQRQLDHAQTLAEAHQLHQQLLQLQQQRQLLQQQQQQLSCAPPRGFQPNPTTFAPQDPQLGPEACPYFGGGGGGGGPAGAAHSKDPFAAPGQLHGPATGTASVNTHRPSHLFSSAFATPDSRELQQLRLKCALQKKLLGVITKAHDMYFQDDTPNGCKVGDFLLASLLDLTQSKFGFIASVLYKTDGTPYMKTHAVTNFAWTRELRAWYVENAHKGLVFSNLKTLFGEVMTSGEAVISNDPKNDPRSSGVPPGHATMHSFLGIPAYLGADMVGMFGISNRPGGYDEVLVKELQPVIKTVAQVVFGINKRKRRTEAENRLFSVLKVAREGMIAVAPSGFVSTLNPAARSMFGIPATFGVNNNRSSGSLSSSSSSGRIVPASEAEGLPHMAEDALPFEDLFYSINSREDFMKLGLENHLNQVYPALGRKLDGSTLLVEISLSKGEMADVAFVAIVRQLETPWEDKSSS